MNDFNPACAGAREQLGALIDGELNDRDAAGVRAHLDVCTACRKLEWELRDDWNLLETLGAGPEPSDEAAARILAGVRSHLARRRRAIFRAAVGAVAALVVLAVTFVTLRPAGRVDPELMDHLPVLVDLQSETQGLDSELVDLLLDELEATATNDSSRGQRKSEAESDHDVTFEFILEEELLAGATRL